MHTQARPAKKKEKKWPKVQLVRHRNGTAAWLVDTRIAGKGERLFFKSKAEADTKAEQLRIRRKNEGGNAIGNDELAKYGKTVQDAINFYLENLRKIEKSVPLTIGIEELIALKQGAGKSKRYCNDLSLRLGRFSKAFPDRTCGSVSAQDLDHWLSGLPVAAGTRNTFRRDLRTLFSFCEKRGYVTRNPASDTERAKGVASPVEILTPEEALAVLNACTPDVLPYTAIGLFAGLRAAEIGKLDWKEVDLEGGVIEVKAAKSKTASHRLVKIEPVLKAWLAPHVKAFGPVAPIGLRKRLDAARRLAGFGPEGSETEEEREAGLKLRPWPQNALRHSFGTYWLAMYQDAAACALQMGNSPAMIFAHYRRPMQNAVADKFWNILPDQCGHTPLSG